MIKRFFNIIAIASLMLILAPVQAAENKDPYLLVKDVASATFDRMKQEQGNIQNDSEVLRQIVEQELLPHVDHKYSALMVLGANAKKVPREQLLEFIETFRTYLITTYASALGYYTDQTVEFEPAKNFQGKSKLTIKAMIKEQGRDDIDVAFKVRFTKDKTWKAYDMVAEGVSMLDSKRSEFAGVIRQKGVEEAIKLMKQKSSQPIKLQSQSE